MRDGANTHASRRRQGGLAGKFPEATEGVDEIVDSFAATLVETVVYFIWYFWAPIAIGLFVRRLPIIRLIPKDIVGICVGGCAQIVWSKYLSLGRPSQLDIILSRLVRSPRRVNHARLVSEGLGVLVGCWCLGQAWRFLNAVSDLNPLTVTLLNMPGLPQFNPLNIPTNEPSQIKPELEALIAAFTTEFILSFFHWWGVGLAVIGVKKLHGIQHFRCFVTPALVTLGRVSLGHRPSVNSSVALIGGFKNPKALPSLLVLVAADLLAAVSVILIPRYLKMRSAYTQQQRHRDAPSLDTLKMGGDKREETRDTVVVSPDEDATYLKTSDKPILPESASTMPSSSAAIAPPSQMVTRGRAKNKSKTPPLSAAVN